MTDQYQQRSINLDRDSNILEQMSFDERDVLDIVPNGTTATYRKYKMPVAGRLSRISWSAIFGAVAGESIALRLFWVRPQSSPSGFGYIQLNDTYTISEGSLSGAGDDVDFSDKIRSGIIVTPGDYLAASWVHSGPQGLRPLNMNWNFTPVESVDTIIDASFITTNYAEVFG